MPPTGYFIPYGGQFESQASASRLILLLGAASFPGMFLLLYLQFQSVSLALQVMLNIPLAFIGAVIGIWFFSDRTVSIASMVGFIALDLTVRPLVFWKFGRRATERHLAAGNTD